MREWSRAALILCALAGGCDRAKDGGGPQAPRKETTVAGRQAYPAVMAERRAFGRWRSPDGILAGNKTLWVIIDVAGTKDVRVELRGFSPRGETVYASAVGTAAIDATGVDVVMREPPSSLWAFGKFRGVFPSTSRMRVRVEDGREFEFTYAGV